MHFLNPGLLGTRNNFLHRYANPIMKQADHPVKEKLAQLLKPFILRRSKQQVLKELPPVTETVVYCEMDAQQQSMYDSEKSKVRNALLDQMDHNPQQKGKAVMVLKALMKLRQIANHPVLVDPDYSGGSGKFESIIETIQTIVEEQHQLLVFSSFVGHLNLLANYFEANETPFAMLTGATTNREHEINRFKKDPEVSIFLISLKAGGVGLNLAEASYVLLIDPWWNPSAELQAIGRSHRIGQKSKVFVYRFITMQTLEEKIKKLQEKKLGLPENLIEEEQYLSEMSLEALIELIN
jgi:SNF2 family DNA or RNA helicase